MFTSQSLCLASSGYAHSPMNAPLTVSWRDASGIAHDAGLVTSAFGAREPAHIVTADDTMTADTAYRLACEGTALVWHGDYQNARQLLQAMTRRVDTHRTRKRIKTPPPALGDPALFHTYRQAQSARAKILGMLWVPLTPQGSIPLRRAPEISDAIVQAFGPAEGSGLRVISLREVLGVVGAAQWRERGVPVPSLGPEVRIHPYYGVFSPVRGEYLDLVAQMPISPDTVAWDIGTGTGVLAALLALRGAAQVVATDTAEQALVCARDNLVRLDLTRRVQVVRADLFPAGRADIIVCNPPWLPGRPTSAIEHGIYDADSRMLKGFLQGLRSHLTDRGEGWLILSDLAERLGLRHPDDLSSWFEQAGLTVVDRLQARPAHPKTVRTDDPLHEARSREITSLWRLAVAKPS